MSSFIEKEMIKISPNLRDGLELVKVGSGGICFSYLTTKATKRLDETLKRLWPFSSKKNRSDENRDMVF